MAVRRSLLLIADIGGYTRFMKLHHLSLAHSQEIVARLLDAVIRAVPKLELVELEGDAAFFALPLEEGSGEAEAAEMATRDSIAMHRAFHEQQDQLALNMCPCDGCVQAGQLKVKFVAHVGEAAEQTIGNRKTLAGVDVIAVHRMLKNSVPVPEYVLMSEPLYEEVEPTIRELARSIEEELEGLGSATLYFVDLDEIAEEPPPPPKPTLAGRLRETAGVMARSLPYELGLKRARPLAGSS